MSTAIQKGHFKLQKRLTYFSCYFPFKVELTLFTGVTIVYSVVLWHLTVNAHVHICIGVASTKLYRSHCWECVGLPELWLPTLLPQVEKKTIVSIASRWLHIDLYHYRYNISSSVLTHNNVHVVHNQIMYYNILALDGMLWLLWKKKNFNIFH